GRLQESIRCHPQVHLLSPRGIRANDDGLRRRRWQPATTPVWWYIGEDSINVPCGRLVVNSPRIRLVGECRPRRIYIYRLSESEFCCRPRILNAFNTVSTHRFGCIAENTLRVLRPHSRCRPRRQDREHHKSYELFSHKRLQVVLLSRGMSDSIAHRARGHHLSCVAKAGKESRPIILRPIALASRPQSPQ